ncbi:MAG: tetratricopeptide repeat protein [Asgard group archaeon]|nr:tetratricopeptide repeat protein [Asgard group archaeon]
MSKKEASKKTTKKDDGKNKEKSTSKGSSPSKTKKPTTKPKEPKTDSLKSEGIDDSLLVDGISYIEDNKLEAALECFEDFSKKYPQSHFGWYYVGYTKLLQDKKKDAAKNFKKATKLNNNFIPSQYYEGLIEFEENNFDKALIVFDSIMESFNSDEIKESNFNIPYFIAICHHYIGNLQRAEEYFLFAYNLSPDDPVVLYYKGINELAMRNYDYAMETFKNLLMIDMNYQSFWDLVKGYSYYYHSHEEDNG